MRKVDHPLYGTWMGMHHRCSFPHHASWKYYGAKGIRVCDRWKSFAAFCEDMGERPAGRTLDRIDRARDYSPENCRWATLQQQNSNKSDTRLLTLDGKSMPLAAWAREYGLSKELLHNRVFKQGLPVEIAVTLPRNRRNTMRIKQSLKEQ
jgi:hypothetical protein